MALYGTLGLAFWQQHSLRACQEVGTTRHSGSEKNVSSSIPNDKQNTLLSFFTQRIPKGNFTVDSFIHLANTNHLLCARRSSAHLITLSPSVCFREEEWFWYLLRIICVFIELFRKTTASKRLLLVLRPIVWSYSGSGNPSSAISLLVIYYTVNRCMWINKYVNILGSYKYINTVVVSLFLHQNIYILLLIIP